MPFIWKASVKSVTPPGKSKWVLSGVVDDEHVAQVVHAWTGIPVSQMLESETDKLLRMEDYLHERIIGQDEAIVAVFDAIRHSRAGSKNPRRPIRSSIFLGPTGVGKTGLARVLAEFLFDDPEALLRIDMSEYREAHTASRLMGSPPGYVGYDEGGQLPKPSAVAPTRSSFSTNWKKRMKRYGIPYCRFSKMVV